jgi:hypothetical protein
VIEEGIKQPIRLLVSAQHYPAAIILTYSGMDTMAFLNMPASKTDVMRSDFIAWAEKYVKFSSADPPTGADLYGSRCSVLHGGAPSRFTREGRGRPVLHFAGVRGLAEQGRATLMISVDALIGAFFEGADRFLVDLSRDGAKAEIANRRLGQLRNCVPYL